MASDIDVREVEGDHVRPLRFRQLEPIEYLLDLLLMLGLAVVRLVVSWANALDLSVAAWPEISRGPHSLLLRQRPYRRAAVPGAFLARFVKIELGLPRGIPESV